MIFRPDIKPPMWGPPEAVQWAVRANAEQMGASVKLLMPFWEYGWGQYDIFGESFVTVDKNKLLWESRGLRFTHNTYQDSVYIYTQGITKPYQYNSIFVIYTPITTTQSATLGGTQQNNYFGSNGTGIYLSGQLKAQSQINNNGVELVGNFPNYNQKNYGFVNFGANGELYQDGLLVATGALNKDSGTYNYNYQLGFFAAGSGSSTIVFDFEIAFNTVLNYNQIEQLHYEPYALLMPVARPFIFDMAGGGGTLVTALADLRGTIRNNIQRAADLRAAISTPQAAQADTLTKISRALSQTADSRARISNLQAALSDSKAAVSNTLTQIADTKVSVSEQQQVIVPADTRVGVSNAQSALADLLTALSTTKAAQADTNTAASNTLSATADTRSALSNAIAAQADLSAAVHNQITAICDTRVQVMSDKTVVVSFDTLAKVSNVIAATADSKAAISQPVITAADCRAAISQLATAQADTRTAASNSVTASADTQIIISGLVQVVARCDTLVSVSSLASALADLKVIVGPSGIALSTADIDAIATAVWQKILADETGEGTASQIVQAIRGETEKARKMQTNKAIISGDGQTVSIYDDDGATLLHVFGVSGDKLSRTPQ
jgi:hypothetical protein